MTVKINIRTEKQTLPFEICESDCPFLRVRVRW